VTIEPRDQRLDQNAVVLAQGFDLPHQFEDAA